jgi:hypothetical protein
MVDLETTCIDCEFNRLSRANGDESAKAPQCHAAKRLIEEEFGVRVPCGLAGAALVDSYEGDARLYREAEQEAHADTARALGSLGINGTPEANS